MGRLTFIALVIALLFVPVLAFSAPAVAPTTPTPGYAVFRNDAATSGGTCSGANMSMGYTLLPADRPFGIQYDYLTNCTVKVTLFSNGEGVIAGAAVVGHIFPGGYNVPDPYAGAAVKWTWPVGGGCPSSERIWAQPDGPHDGWNYYESSNPYCDPLGASHPIWAGCWRRAHACGWLDPYIITGASPNGFVNCVAWFNTGTPGQSQCLITAPAVFTDPTDLLPPTGAVVLGYVEPLSEIVRQIHS